MVKKSLNFLVVSKSYLESVKLNQVDGDILLRRSIVVGYLDEKYGASKNLLPKIMEDLGAKGIATTYSSVRKDIEVHRLAYRYYHGEKEAALKRLENKKDFATKPLRFLIEDGFDSWEKIIQAIDPLEKVVEQADEDIETTGEESPVGFIADDHIAEVFDDRLHEPFVKINLIIADLIRAKESAGLELQNAFNVLGEKEARIEELTSEVLALRQQAVDLETQNEMRLKELEGKVKESNQMLELADVELVDLEEQNNQLRIELEKFSMDKDVFDKIRELAALIPNNNELTKGDNFDESQVELEPEDFQLEITLPTESEKFEKTFKYSKCFMETFNALERSDRILVAKTMEFFSLHGPSYRSLRSNKQLFNKGALKVGEKKSRAGKFLRFTWEVKEDAVHIIGLFRKKELV